MMLYAQLSGVNSAILREKASDNHKAVAILYRIREILARAYGITI